MEEELVNLTKIIVAAAQKMSGMDTEAIFTSLSHVIRSCQTRKKSAEFRVKNPELFRHLDNEKEIVIDSQDLFNTPIDSDNTN